MRHWSITSLALLLSSSAWALPSLPITFQDVLASQDPSDVIGNPSQFDIDYLKISALNGNTLQIDIRFNYGGGKDLNGFTIDNFAPTLNVGDLILKTANNNSYAFILAGHNGLVEDTLYSITGTKPSMAVLGMPSGSYRPMAPVWAKETGAVAVSQGSSDIVTVGGIDTQLLASLYIPLTSTLLAEMDNGFSFYFASATCGNDEITGRIPASGVPEPSTWALLGTGLIVAGAVRRKR